MHRLQQEADVMAEKAVEVVVARRQGGVNVDPDHTLIYIRDPCSRYRASRRIHSMVVRHLSPTRRRSRVDPALRVHVGIEELKGDCGLALCVRAGR